MLNPVRSSRFKKELKNGEMSWVVSTCILIDVLEDDPDFGRASVLS